MIKKFLCVLTVVLALLLCGCEGFNEPATTVERDLNELLDEILTTTVPEEVTNVEDEEPETTTPPTEAPETDAPETEAPVTDAPKTDAPETDAPETEETTKKTEATTKKTEAKTDKPSDDESKTVYTTPTGKRYHFDEACGGKNAKPTTLGEAVKKGLTPCKKCAGG